MGNGAATATGQGGAGGVSSNVGNGANGGAATAAAQPSPAWRRKQDRVSSGATQSVGGDGGG